MAYVWDDYLGDFTWSDDGSDDSGGVWDDYTGDFVSGWNDWDEFEQDWADVTGGRYTIDEIASGDDVQDLYEASSQNRSILDTIGGLISRYGKGAIDNLKSIYKKPDGKTDWARVAATAGGIAGLMGLGKSEQRPTGYQGGIPKYTAVRERVQDTYDPNRRPGSSGQRYFSDIKYAPDADVATAQAAAAEQAAGLAALNAANPARQVIPVQQPPSTTTPAPEPTAAPRAAAKVIEDLPVPTQTLATGGIAGLKQGKYLRGATDGMTDELRTTIEGEQPAALSHGEFVVPADVVSHLGNGNSEAGAKKLYEMMDKIRQARTGTKKQGKQINPNKYLPV